MTTRHISLDEIEGGIINGIITRREAADLIKHLADNIDAGDIKFVMEVRPGYGPDASRILSLRVGSMASASAEFRAQSATLHIDTLDTLDTPFEV
jgi:hypothetical protein